MNRKRQGGFSLLEVMIASVILLVIILLTILILMSTQSVYNDASITSDLEERCRLLSETYKAEMLYCQITNIAADGTSITWQVPLANNPDGTLTYGYNGNATLSAALVFSPENIIREQNGVAYGAGLPEDYDATGERDFNKDGDINDTFLRGKVLKYVFDTATGTILDQATASDLAILQVGSLGLLNADMDGDGTFDPLFNVLDLNGATVPAASIASSGVSIQINTWHGTYDESKKGFHIRNIRTVFKFRNKQ